MEKDFKALFAQIDPALPPKELLDAVLSRVRLEQKRAARREIFLVGSLALGSLVAIIPAISYFLNSLIQSSFYQYLSLVFSDGTSVLTFWKEMIMSLAESLPLLGLVGVLTIVVVFLWSVSRTTRDAKILFKAA